MHAGTKLLYCQVIMLSNSLFVDKIASKSFCLFPFFIIFLAFLIAFQERAKERVLRPKDCLGVSSSSQNIPVSNFIFLCITSSLSYDPINSRIHKLQITLSYNSFITL
jgi:hypothetical protein